MLGITEYRPPPGDHRDLLQSKINRQVPSLYSPIWNKATKLTKVLSESDVYSSSPPELAQRSSTHY